MRCRTSPQVAQPRRRAESAPVRYLARRRPTTLMYPSGTRGEEHLVPLSPAGERRSRTSVTLPGITAATEENEVLSVFDALFVALVAHRDADAGTALFADDADVVMWGSEERERAEGRSAIAALHRDVTAFAGQLAFRWRDRHVHVHGDAAWVNAVGELSVRLAGQAPRTGPYRLTAVLVRQDRTWRWHTFNGSEPRSS